MSMPGRSPADGIRIAIADRERTDYRFDFWTAFGWTVLTFGIFSFYVFYQLVRRSRDHNRRRVQLLSAATQTAGELAAKQGKSDELGAEFLQVSDDVESLRKMDGDFRDPTLWTLLSIIGGGLVWAVGAILLDQDLVRHERHERAAEAGLTRIFAELGIALPAPVGATKRAHNYVGRIVAVIFSLGLYSFWWVADLMREGNANYAQDMAWEDALAQASLQLTPTAS